MMRKKIIPFIIFNSFLILLTESGCPSTCHCKNISVSCIEADLACVPNFDSLTNSPVIIDLSGNSINYIHVTDLSYEKSNETKELYLNGSEVVSIDERSFNELENLQELYLGNNLLTAISESIIEKLDNICLLELSNNYFKTSFPKVRSKSLEVLAIANSKVSNIPVGALDQLPSLRMLILERNNLQYIDPAAFNKFEMIFTIKLNYNPWNCDCKTVQLFKHLAQKQFIGDGETIKCATDSTYIDLFNNGMIVKSFMDYCKNEKIYAPINETRNRIFSADIIINNPSFSDTVETLIEEKEEQEKELKISSEFYYNIYVLCVCLLAVFAIGVVCGCILNVAISKKRQIESTESTIKLMA